MADVDEVLDEAARGVIVVMVWVTLRRRVRETRTGVVVCRSLQSRHPLCDVMTVSGQRQRRGGVGRVQLRVCNGDAVVVDVYVVDFKPLGFEFILGINGISAPGIVTIFSPLATRFWSAKADEEPVCAGATKMENPVCAGATKVGNRSVRV